MPARLFGRLTGRASDAVAAAAAPLVDERTELGRLVGRFEELVERSGGVLPPEAVVLARRVADQLRLVLVREDLRTEVLVAVRGIAGDYLPTSVERHLAVVAHDPGAQHDAQLIDQLEVLFGAASDLVEAVRDDDLRALEAQGIFLETRFTGSDL